MAISKQRIIMNNIFMIRRLFQYVPLYVIGEALFGVLTAIPEVIANVVLMKYIMDIVSEGTALYRIVYAVAGYAAFVLLTIGANSIYISIYVPRAQQVIHLKMQSELYQKAIEMDLTKYDDPEYYSDFVWAMTSAETRALKTLSNMRSCISNGSRFLTVSAVFIIIDPVILVVIGAAAAVTLLLNFPIANSNYQREAEILPFQRKREYIERVFYLPQYAKELRLTQVKKIMLRDYEETTSGMQSISAKYNKRRWILHFCQVYIPGFVLIGFIMVLYLGYKIIVTHEMGVGDFAAAYNGVNLILAAIYFFLGPFLTQLNENGLFIEKFRAFLQSKPHIQGGNRIAEAKHPHLIDIRNISFRYQDNKMPVLRDVSMKIQPGYKIAVVGRNGAGKSTFIKLLMRLYDVDQGDILYNEETIQSYSLLSYRRCFTAAFQDFQIYAATAAENVSMGKLYQDERVRFALQESMFPTERLHKGIETSLLREFDDEGILLSGGEMQRLAFARTLYQNNPIIVLDEPASALDPIAEREMNQKLIEMAQGKTLILITHRLSATRMADVIYMLEDGRLIESGSHHELMRLNGKYAQMYTLQKEQYSEELS